MKIKALVEKIAALVVIALFTLGAATAATCAQTGAEAPSAAPTPAGQPVTFEHFTVKDGLVDDMVFQVLQARSGLIWISTRGGLNKFDGSEFTAYVHDPENQNSLNLNYVWTMREATDGTLWLSISGETVVSLLQECLALEWEYEKTIEVGEKEGEAILAPPPEEEMEILLDLARRGNLRAIRERAAHIETLGEQYASFARRLSELAKSFEERELMALVERYMGEETESEERRSRL
jgi:hypothetical protein